MKLLVSKLPPQTQEPDSITDYSDLQNESLGANNRRETNITK